MMMIIIIITRAFRERKPPPTSKFQPKVIRDSNPNFWINQDLDFCWICPKMLWMHYLVGISHFTEYGTNQPLTVREMLTMSKNPLFRNGYKNKQEVKVI